MFLAMTVAGFPPPVARFATPVADCAMPMAGAYGRMGTAYLGVAGSYIGMAKVYIGVAGSYGPMGTATTGMAGSATGVEELETARPAPQKGRAKSAQGRDGVSPSHINPQNPHAPTRIRGPLGFLIVSKEWWHGMIASTSF